MMEAIKQWLDNPDREYKVGVELYAVARHNKNMLRLLQRNDSPGNMAKLIYHLEKLVPGYQAASPDAKTEHPPELETPKPIVEVIRENLADQDRKDKLMFLDLPEALRPVLMQKTQAYIRMCMLKVQLNELPPLAEPEALALQFQLDDLWKFNALCWKKLDYWSEHRAVSPELNEKLETLTAPALLRRQALLFASKSKLEKRIAVNQAERSIATDQLDITRLDKAIAKASGNLIAQEELLLKITLIIEGRNG